MFLRNTTVLVVRFFVARNRNGCATDARLTLPISVILFHFRMAITIYRQYLSRRGTRRKS